MSNVVEEIESSDIYYESFIRKFLEYLVLGFYLVFIYGYV